MSILTMNEIIQRVIAIGIITVSLFAPILSYIIFFLLMSEYFVYKLLNSVYWSVNKDTLVNWFESE